MSAQAGGPLGGFAEVREFCGDVGMNGYLERNDVVQDAEGVFAHFLAGEEFGQFFGEVEAELESVGRDSDADVVIAQQKAVVSACDCAAGVEKPSFGACTWRIAI